LEVRVRKRYAVVVSASETSHGVHASDADGCIAVARMREEAIARFGEALAFHFEGMVADGDPIPEPTTTVEYVEVEVPAPVATG
jgi:predicted RNase H-like HicB family nuclease